MSAAETHGRSTKLFVGSIVTILVSFVVFLAGYRFLLLRGEYGGDFSVLVESNYVRVSLLFFSMIFGSFSQALHDELNDSQRRRTSGTVSRALKSKGFLSAVLVAPITFLGVYNMAKEQPDGIVAVCLAFQFGFFWRSVFKDHPVVRTTTHVPIEE